MFDSKISNGFIKFTSPEFVHKDDRGSLTQIVSKGRWDQVNYIESDPGSVRGDHYHEINRELFYIIEGQISLVLEKGENKFIYDIVAGDIFIIEPFVRHSFEYKKRTLLISMYDKGVQLDGGKMDMIS